MPPPPRDAAARRLVLLEVHLIWHNSKDPQNLGGGLGPEQQAWEVEPSRTQTRMDRWTHTHTHRARNALLPPTPTPGNKWPFLQPGGGWGGHTLTPLSTTSQAIVLEFTAPWQRPWERKEQRPGGRVVRSSWMLVWGAEAGP